MYSDDLASMTRGMRTAGVQQILGTLWDAEDATYAALIPETIRRIADGAAPAAALPGAQSDGLEARRTDAPIRASPFFRVGAVVFK